MLSSLTHTLCSHTLLTYTLSSKSLSPHTHFLLTHTHTPLTHPPGALGTALVYLPPPPLPADCPCTAGTGRNQPSALYSPSHHFILIMTCYTGFQHLVLVVAVRSFVYYNLYLLQPLFTFSLYFIVSWNVFWFVLLYYGLYNFIWVWTTLVWFEPLYSGFYHFILVCTTLFWFEPLLSGLYNFILVL